MLFDSTVLWLLVSQRGFTQIFKHHGASAMLGKLGDPGPGLIDLQRMPFLLSILGRIAQRSRFGGLLGLHSTGSSLL